MTANNKLHKFNPKIFISLQRVLNKLAYKRGFDYLHENYSKGNNLLKLEKQLLKIREEKQRNLTIIAFSKIFYRSKITKQMSLLLPTLNKVFKSKL